MDIEDKNGYPIQIYSKKDLMKIYKVYDYLTWNKMIEPIKHKLNANTRRKYTPREVRFIFDYLGMPTKID